MVNSSLKIDGAFPKELGTNYMLSLGGIAYELSKSDFQMVDTVCDIKLNMQRWANQAGLLVSLTTKSRVRVTNADVKLDTYVSEVEETHDSDKSHKKM